MNKLIRAAVLALALIAGFSPAFAQAPPPVPALPDAERRTSYVIAATTCICNVNFALYGDSTDYASWVEVYLNGVRVNFNDGTFGWTITSPTGALGSIPRPVTDAVLTFNGVQTGTVQIVGARRPRRTSTFAENRGVAARDLNQILNDMIAQNRETWDKTNDVTGRALLSQPGNTLALLPLPSACQSKFLGFDATGLIPQCNAGGAGSGNVVGPISSTDGDFALFDGATGALLKDGPSTVIRNTTANKLWAGPTSGGAAAPGFRSMVTADLPTAQALATANVARLKLTTSTIFQVDPTGSDSNLFCSGTGTSACATIQGALNNIAQYVDINGQNWSVTTTTSGAYAPFTIGAQFTGDTNCNGSIVGSPSLAITGATNATPIVITAVGHNYANGDHVIISGVGGNAAANGAFKVASANIGANTFALTKEIDSTNVVGTGAFTSGGTVQAPNKVTIAATGGAGTTTASPITVQTGGCVSVSGFKISSTNAQLAVAVDGGEIILRKMQYDAAGAGQQQLWGTRGGRIRIVDSYSISGFGTGNSQFMQSSHGGNIRQEGATGFAIAALTYDVTTTGFLYALNGEIVTTASPSGAPFSANGFTVTARKWVASELGIIQVEGSGPPSDSLVLGGGNGFFCTNNIGGVPQSGPSICYSLTSPNAVQIFSGTAGIQILRNDNAQTLWTVPNTQLGPGTFSVPSAGGTLAANAFGQLPATATNDSASAGNVGEFINASVVSGSAVALTTNIATNITSISLTAGDWDVSGVVALVPAGTTTTSFLAAGITTTSATLPGTLGTGSGNERLECWPSNINTAAGFAPPWCSIGPARMTLAGTTTVFLVAFSTFAVSTNAGYGFIRARRVR